jgi:hypothetical protein
MIAFSGPLKIWTNEEGSSHFVNVPAELVGEIKAHSLGNPRGFGSVKVEVTVQDIRWRTSIFPSKSSGGYFLPIKIDVIRKAGIAAGDELAVEFDLL